MDQTSIAEGWGGFSYGADSLSVPGMLNVRQKYIQGISTGLSVTSMPFTGGSSLGIVPNSTLPAGVTGNGSAFYCTRRYQINLALGLFTQDKLIPTKFMASQLAIELTLETAPGCIFVTEVGSGITAYPTYGVSNVNLIPEIQEFDASYDGMFLRGLREGGVYVKSLILDQSSSRRGTPLHFHPQCRQQSICRSRNVRDRSSLSLRSKEDRPLYTPQTLMPFFLILLQMVDHLFRTINSESVEGKALNLTL